MDIKVKHEGKEYCFTLRSNAKEIALKLTAFSDGDFNWSVYSEQCKQPEKRTVISIPDCVAIAAKSSLQDMITVTNQI